jgi:hypothetical protein
MPYGPFHILHEPVPLQNQPPEAVAHWQIGTEVGPVGDIQGNHAVMGCHVFLADAKQIEEVLQR